VNREALRDYLIDHALDDVPLDDTISPLLDRITKAVDYWLDENPTAAIEVERELVKARAKHAPMHSLHEAYAVIYEELDEFWDEVRRWRPADPAGPFDVRTQGARARRELIQTAAMCLRAIEDLDLR
jgi:hypothetical protein